MGKRGGDWVAGGGGWIREYEYEFECGAQSHGSSRKERKEVRFDIKGEEARAGKMD